MRSLVLLSGGLDSCVATAIAVRGGLAPVLALSINYGQRHIREQKSAEAIADFYGLDFETLDVPIGDLISKGTALVGTDEKLPESRSVDEMPNSIPRSYVPGRNTMMLAIASSIAEANEIDYVITGFNAVDYSGYPDCRPEFVHHWNMMAKVATKRGIEGHPVWVNTPVIEMSKIDIVRQGFELGAPLELTWSCYRGGDLPCGKCDSCLIRRAAFRNLEKLDPALEQKGTDAGK